MKNKKLEKFIENSDIDGYIKDFLIECLVMKDKDEMRYRKKYVDLAKKYAGGYE